LAPVKNNLTCRLFLAEKPLEPQGMSVRRGCCFDVKMGNLLIP
jgi:hypothetical protein